ncbi:MAG: phytanoyl-CoA dioxygenase family protein [Phycisphaeraceae bacterium]
MPDAVPGYEPFLDSSDVRHDTNELRRRARRDGYLFISNLLDADSLTAVRRDFAGILADEGWLLAGSDPMELRTNHPATTEQDEGYDPVLRRFQQLESFHRLPHDARLTAVIRAIVEEDVLVHPRHIGRIIFPNSHRTPPHQDFTHIAGTPDTWTVWIPLGDVPAELGPLAILPGTHESGLLPEVPMPGAGGAGIRDEDLPHREWCCSPFAAGDVLFLHSHCVHAGTPNQTEDRIRLSCDCRYQGLSQPVHENSLAPHLRRFGWDHVYQSWHNNDLQYYWQRYDLNIQQAHAQQT